MRNIITILFLFTCLSAFGQIRPENIKLFAPDDPDSVQVLLTDSSGVNKGRGNFRSLKYLGALLSRYIESSGSGLTDGDKGDITVSGSGATWDIDANTIGATEISDGAINLTVTGVIDSYTIDNSEGSDVKLLGDGTTITLEEITPNEITFSAYPPDLSSVTDDRSFYDYGTTDMPVTSDDSIETTNNKYVLFNGVKSTIPTKVEILKEGYLNFNKSGYHVGADWILRVDNFDALSPSTPFGITHGVFDNVAGRRNNTYSVGLNPLNEGVLGTNMLNFEGNYHTVTDSFFETHFVVVPQDGKSHRWGTFIFNKANVAEWHGTISLNQLKFTDPRSLTDDSTYFKITEATGHETALHLLSAFHSVGGNTKGVVFDMDGTNAGETFSIARTGIMPSSCELYMASFRRTRVNLLNLDSLGSTASSILGIDGNNDITTATISSGLSFSGGALLNTHLDWYQIGTTNVPTAISQNRYFTGNLAIGATTARGLLDVDNIYIGTAGATHGYIRSGDGMYFISDYDNNGGDGSIHFQNSGSDKVVIADDGVTTFTADPIVPDEVYGVGWDASLEPPTKNAVYDKVQTLDGSTTNELQTITNSSDATSHTVTLSSSGGSAQFVEGSNITLTTTGTGSAGIVTIASTASGYTDEQAQDAVGGMVNASLTYTDGTPLLTIADRDFTDITTTSAGTVMNIDADAVGTNEIATDGVDAAEIATDAVRAAEISAGAVDASELASTAVTAASYVEGGYTVDADGRLTAAFNPTTISPSQLTSDQDNYNPTGFGKAKYVRLSSDSGMRAITGLVDSTGGTHEKVIFNVGSYTIYFPQDHPDATAANRFTGWSGDYHLFPGKSCSIYYDGTSSRWRIMTDESETGRTGVFYEMSASSVTVGDYGAFGVTAINSGSVTAGASTTSLPVCTNLNTLATSTGGGEVQFVKTNAGPFAAFASAHIYAEAYISTPTALSDGSDTYTSELQITNAAISNNLENNNLFGIRYSHGINGGKWQLFSQDNSAGEAVADCGVTVQASVLYKLRIEVDKSKTEARAYINDAYVARVTGNLPNSVTCGARIVHLKSAGSTATVFKIHSFKAGAIYN